MNKSPLTKKQIVNLFKKQKTVIFDSEKVNLENSEDRFPVSYTHLTLPTTPYV